jgi:hypothetical protein
MFQWRAAVTVLAGCGVAAPAVAQDHPAMARPGVPAGPAPLASIIPPGATGRLLIKLIDEVKGSVLPDGTVESRAGCDLDDLVAIFEAHGLQPRRAFGTGDAALAELEARAWARSGSPQPHLAGIVLLEGAGADPGAALAALAGSPLVDWVQCETAIRLCGGGGPTGACCIIDTCFADMTEEACTAVAGGWAGAGSACAQPQCSLSCGSVFTGSCYVVCGTPTPNCSDADCCALVCIADPFCCESTWDDVCADQANLECDGSGADRCATPFNGGCFLVHATAGCNQSDCCGTVCDADPICCTTTWDAGCVQLALEHCVASLDAAATPDFRAFQGYLTPEHYDDPVPSFLPLECDGDPEHDFHGEGWFLSDADDPYAGLYGLGLELLEVYGIDASGQGPLTRGKTVRVGVIDLAFHTGHEDLDVTVEPGQTILEIPSVTLPDHGSAMLSVIGARDDGAGVVGVAPDAELWFFPLTSVEEGPRELSAWASAMSVLGPGDVLCVGYSPGQPAGSLNNQPATWTLVRMASDLGITVCMPAGNDCYNLDAAPDLGDSGGMVVGGCMPAFPYVRNPFSNFCTNVAQDLTRSNIVHACAWAERVVGAGYGDLFRGQDDPSGRCYTAQFSGTSAATAQVAGLVACLQGLARQFYGISLMPEQVRAAIGIAGIDTLPERPCPNNLICDEPSPMPRDLIDIGPYPTTVGTAAEMLTNSDLGFPDSPWLGAVLVVRGHALYGNHFSVAADDNNYLVVESEFTLAGSQPDGIGGDDGLGDPLDNPIADIVYIASGQICDLVVSSQAELVNPRAGLLVEVDAHTAGGFALLFVELYDWNLGHFTFAGFSIMPGPPGLGADTDPNLELSSNFAARYFHPDTDQLLLRLWTFGFGGEIGDAPGFNIGGPQVNRFDLINYRLTSGFGVVPGP